MAHIIGARTDKRTSTTPEEEGHWHPSSGRRGDLVVSRLPLSAPCTEKARDFLPENERRVTPLAPAACRRRFIQFASGPSTKVICKVDNTTCLLLHLAPGVPHGCLLTLQSLDALDSCHTCPSGFMLYAVIGQNQGDPLSPVLFCAGLKPLLGEFKAVFLDSSDLRYLHQRQ